MSPALLIGICYAAVALFAGVVALRGAATVGRWSGPPAWLMVAVLWPFLLPGLVATPAAVSSVGRGPYSERLAALSRALAAALDDRAAAGLLGRPRADVEDGVRRLEVEVRRLEELDAAIAAALPAAQPRLVALRARAEAQVVERVRLLEEVAAQLTVLRFVDLSAPDGAREEQQRVEALLVQLDALVSLGAAPL